MKRDDKILDVLIISWSFPPISGPRAIKAEAIVTELLELGHRVTLITRRGCAEPGENVANRLHALFLMPSGEWPTLTFDLHKSESFFSPSWFARKINGLLLHLFCYPQVGAFFRAQRALGSLRGKTYDLTITVDGPQPLHWAVARARYKNTAAFGQWIADCGDPLLRKLEGNKPALYFRYVENFFLKTADVVTVPVPQGVEYFEPKFLSKIFTVPHSLLFPSRKQIEMVRRDAKKANRTKFAYAGNLAPYRKHLVEFCKSLPAHNRFEFHIFGPNEVIMNALTVEFPNLSRQLFCHGTKDRFELLEMLHYFDFLVLFTYPSGFQVPFKIIDYAFTMRPILHFDSTLEGIRRLNSFMRGDYKEAFPVPDYEKYDSRNTVRQYLELADGLR